VQLRENKENRFNGFYSSEKPLKRLCVQAAADTRLKPGVNEMSETATHCCESTKERSLSGESGGCR